jgi:outer membrane protein assembly factor BamB
MSTQIRKTASYSNKAAKSIALLLILTFATLLTSVSMQGANAIDVTTYAYISVEPNPVGINQPVLVSVWILPLQPTGTDVFHNLKVTITSPTGSTDTRTLTTSTVGSQYFSWTPTAVGSYTFKLNYPGETFTRGGYYYTPAESPTITLTVQSQPIPSYPETAIPNDYWTRPINGQNRGWASSVGDWLMNGYNATGKAFDAQFGFNPYSQAPRSSHIMWTKELGLGGIVGGAMGDQSYYAGLSYESKASPAIVMEGRLYYNIKPSSSINQGFVCVDLRTGKELWRNTNWTYSITLGQELEYTTGNQGGVAGAYLWQTGSVYRMFDAFSGDLLLTFANASTGTNVFDSNGNLLVYTLNGAGRWLSMWNSTRALDKSGLIQYNPSGEGMYRPSPRDLANPVSNPYNWLLGVQWNNTNLPAVNMTVQDIAANGTVTGTTTLYPALFGVTGNTLLAQVGSANYPVVYYELGYSLTDGSQKWIQPRNTTTPAVWGSTGEGKYIRVFLDTRTHRCYSADTGEQLWVSEAMDFPWGAFGSQYGTVAYDKFYWGGYDGHEYAFDLNTGKILWKFGSGPAGYETPYGSYPFWYGPVIAGGIVFAGTGEHSPSQPLIRGERLFAIDANAGTQLWNISGLMVTRSIADGYLTTYNAYDNLLYCFGKGPSATTVFAPDVAVPAGTALTITGSVTDQSEGQKGTPAIADKDMTPWMEYLKMQQPIPTGVTIHGVDLILTATGPDGNTVQIGTTVSDMSGHYGMSWTPQTPGLYKITATFVGSDSYGSSYDETFVTVGSPSPSASARPTPTPTTPITTPTATISATPSVVPTSAPGAGLGAEYYIAIAAVVIIVAIAAIAVVLRRRK